MKSRGRSGEDLECRFGTTKARLHQADLTEKRGWLVRKDPHPRQVDGDDTPYASSRRGFPTLPHGGVMPTITSGASPRILYYLVPRDRRCLYSPRCREGLFSETHIPHYESLYNGTGGKPILSLQSLAPKMHLVARLDRHSPPQQGPLSFPSSVEALASTPPKRGHGGERACFLQEIKKG